MCLPQPSLCKAVRQTILCCSIFFFFQIEFEKMWITLLFTYLMNISRQEEERRRREEEMMIRQREMEEQMRRQREESYSRMGYMDPVSKFLL